MLRATSPVNAMLFVGLSMTSVVIDVEVKACRRQRRMPEVVAHEPQVDLAVRHVRARGVTQPVSRKR